MAKYRLRFISVHIDKSEHVIWEKDFDDFASMAKYQEAYLNILLATTTPQNADIIRTHFKYECETIE